MRCSSYDSVRSLSVLRSKSAAALLFLLTMPAPALCAPNMTPVHLRVAGREVTGSTPSVTDGKEVFVPLEALLPAGAIGRLSVQGDSAIVTRLTDWKRGTIPITRVEGRPLLPLSEVARFLEADVEWSANTDKDGKAVDDTRGDTVYLLARIKDVRVANGAVRVTTSFPVPFQVRNLTVEGPVRGYVDCVGAEVPRDFAPASLPRAMRGMSIHAGRFTTETARVVIVGIKLKEADATTNANQMIFAHLGAANLQMADARTMPDREPAPLGQDIPNDPGARVSSSNGGSQTAPPAHNPPVRPAHRWTKPSRGSKRIIGVYSLSLTPVSKSRARLDIATGGPINPFIHYLKDGRHIEIDLPYTQLQLEDADTGDQNFRNPLLKGLHAEQAQQDPPMTRITLETSRVLDWNVTAQGEKLSLDLGVPSHAYGALAGKLIVVDPGHGGASSGATGGSAMEKNITLAISLKLRDVLQAAGARVVMTRDRDATVDLYARPRLANSLNADLFVSIHNDSGPHANTASGTSTWYHMGDPSSRALAICVQQAVSAVTDLPSRGALSDGIMYQHGFAVLRLSKMPAILVEVAYINNAHDRASLLDEDFQERVAQAIVRGIKNYIEGNPQTAENTPAEADTAAGDNPPAGDGDASADEADSP
ncbi:MAG TPA: N-acetylmuramoyl-L-alanine amidase [Chthonomonadaceae bacterium]|nr:N-acetylmuramoyl-L-alanine amidase [Chthonomonadaceae bacterium]